MDVIEAETAALSLRAAYRDKNIELDRMTARRAALPRTDKKGAAELLAKINITTGEKKALRNQAIHAEGVYDRKELHGLWESAVLNLWGADGLAACRAQMRQLKLNREKENDHA
jgi:hypothetical protein